MTFTWALKVRCQAMQGAGLDKAVEALSRLVGAEGVVKIMSEEDVASELLQTFPVLRSRGQRWAHGKAKEMCASSIRTYEWGSPHWQFRFERSTRRG